jgi:4-hydroxybenzoate polyprenyltransferase
LGISIKAYLDILRLHFFFVWPVLFSAGLFLGLSFYGGFSWWLIVKAVLIGFFGFEAGLVLNDIIDRDIDKKEVEVDKLTKYWRVFGSRPLPSGVIPLRNALGLFFGLVIITSVLIFTLPLTNAINLFVIMIICYSLEAFYQIVKRNQSFPIAQLVGRVDFTLFPLAGYLVVGNWDLNLLFFGLFFYPLALAHLGVNDLADVTNDMAKDMKTVPVLYGLKGTAYWIFIFSVFHIVAAILFANILGPISFVGFGIGFFLLTVANYKILKEKSAESAMKSLPLFHVTMLIYAISIIATYFL